MFVWEFCFFKGVVDDVVCLCQNHSILMFELMTLLAKPTHSYAASVYETMVLRMICSFSLPGAYFQRRINYRQWCNILERPLICKKYEIRVIVYTFLRWCVCVRVTSGSLPRASLQTKTHSAPSPPQFHHTPVPSTQGTRIHLDKAATHPME